MEEIPAILFRPNYYLADISLLFEFSQSHKILLENFVLQFNDSHSSICNKYMQSKVWSKNKRLVANEMPSRN